MLSGKSDIISHHGMRKNTSNWSKADSDQSKSAEFKDPNFTPEKLVIRKNRDVWYYDATALCQLHHPMVIFQDPAKASHHSEIQVPLASSSDGDTVSHMETYFHKYLFTKWDFKSMRNKVTVFKWSNLTLLFVPMSCNAPNVCYVPSAAGPYPCWWQWSWTCDSEHGHSQGGSHKQHLAPEKTHRGTIWNTFFGGKSTGVFHTTESLGLSEILPFCGKSTWVLPLNLHIIHRFSQALTFKGNMN